MKQFEQDYAKIVRDVLNNGEFRETRNGLTKSAFGRFLTVPVGMYEFPVIQGRKMFLKGILGEFAAMVRKPKTLKDFEEWGCNYWKQWAKPDGRIEVDYGNAWHADGQIEELKRCLHEDPTNRRMIINGWRPGRLNELDLPCCHLLYQFYVNADGTLDMMWYQRSVDLMIGLPSDIVFAAVWLISLSNEFGYKPGKIHMSLGDCHIYQEHGLAAAEYTSRVLDRDYIMHSDPTYTYDAPRGADFCAFVPDDIHINYEHHCSSLKLELKA